MAGGPLYLHKITVEAMVFIPILSAPLSAIRVLKSQILEQGLFNTGILMDITRWLTSH